MKNYRIYPIGSPAYVYHHGLSKIKNRKNPSAVLAAEFGGFKNPQLAFKLAKLLLEDTPNTLLGKPFLRSEIDWAKEYENHLSGPHADIPFAPTAGKSLCECAHCFYRDAPPVHNPKNDCQIVGKKGNPAKLFFGIPLNTVMPKEIAGKKVGNFCSNYLDWEAE